MGEQKSLKRRQKLRLKPLQIREAELEGRTKQASTVVIVNSMGPGRERERERERNSWQCPYCYQWFAQLVNRCHQCPPAIASAVYGTAQAERYQIPQWKLFCYIIYQIGSYSVERMRHFCTYCCFTVSNLRDNEYRWYTIATSILFENNGWFWWILTTDHSSNRTHDNFMNILNFRKTTGWRLIIIKIKSTNLSSAGVHVAVDWNHLIIFKS